MDCTALVARGQTPRADRNLFQQGSTGPLGLLGAGSSTVVVSRGRNVENLQACNDTDTAYPPAVYSQHEHVYSQHADAPQGTAQRPTVVDGRPPGCLERHRSAPTLLQTRLRSSTARRLPGKCSTDGPRSGLARRAIGIQAVVRE